MLVMPTDILSSNLSDAGNTTLQTELLRKRLSPFGYDVAGVLLTLIAIFGLFNNLCVIVVILRYRTLRTPVNIALLNLSISDSIIAAFGTPLTAAAAFNHIWYFGDAVCQAYAFGMNISGIVSITTLAVISLERYLLITHPRTFELGSKTSTLVIAGVWIYSFLVTFPPLIGWNRYQMETPEIACAIDWESQTANNVSYIIYLFVLGLLVPLAIIFFCYSRIIATVIKQSRSAAGAGVAKSQRKVTIMILAMIATFLLAWIPYAVVSLIALIAGSEMLSATASAAPAILAKSSLIYNPIIYFFLNPTLRQAFLSMFPIRSLLHPTKIAPEKKDPYGRDREQTGAAGVIALSAENGLEMDEPRR